MATPLRSISKPRVMDIGAKRWLYRIAKANHWRVASWIDLDDLIQDGFLCWQIAVTKYPDIDNPKIAMRLFQTIYTNLLHDLANKRTITTEYSFSLFDDAAIFHFEQQACEFGEMLRLVIEAPPLISKCLRDLLFSGLDLSAPYRTWLDGRRETFNDRLCRLLKVDPNKVNLHQALHNYLRNV